MQTSPDNAARTGEIQRLHEESALLLRRERKAFQYIRDKVDQLLVIMGTVPLKPEELEDDTLIDLDPIGIVSDSFAQVLENLRTTNDRLQMAKDENEAIINSVQAGILVMDHKRRILSYNRKMEELFRKGAVDIIGKTCNMVLCNEEVPPVQCVISKMFSTADRKSAASKDWPCRSRFYDVTATPIKGNNGKISRIVVLFSDISRRKQAEQKIKASEERYRDLFENASDLIQIAGPDGMLHYVNRAWRKTLGYSREKIRALNIFDLIHPDCTDHCLELFKKVLQGEQVGKFETKFRAKDGRVILLEGSTSCRFENGQAVSTRGIFRDITEKRRMEEEILKNQKLESVGILAGGIAHDFNNLLASILGNISLAAMEAPSGSPLALNLADAQKACSRAKDLTQQLLTFSKGGAPILKTTSIGNLIKDCAGFTLRGSNVKCDYLLPADLWPVDADDGQISQVLQNLLINGAQAMPGGGIIRIQAENVFLEPHELPLPEGRYVRITVSDHGTGIPPEHLNNIFDPYFTTKEVGSGLGLAISYSIICKHGGLMTVDSEQGMGSSFHVYLPAPEKSIQPAEETPPAASTPHLTGKILFMDDEELVRKMACKMLTTLGHNVHSVEGGEKAIEVYRQALDDAAPFHLVIMDLTIPGGMGGCETVAEILRLDPQARVIVSSGYSTDPVMANFRKYGFCGMVTKPYSLDELKKTVAAALSDQAD